MNIDWTKLNANSRALRRRPGHAPRPTKPDRSDAQRDASGRGRASAASPPGADANRQHPRAAPSPGPYGGDLGLHADADADLGSPDRPERYDPTKRARDAAVEAERNWKRYVEARSRRLATLRSDTPGVEAYLRKLETLEASSDAPRDCDYDLAELASRFSLARLELRDRWLIYEETVAWLQRVRGRSWRDDQRELARRALEPPGPPTALDELKAYFKVA